MAGFLITPETQTETPFKNRSWNRRDEEDSLLIFLPLYLQLRTTLIDYRLCFFLFPLPGMYHHNVLSYVCGSAAPT